MSLSLAEKGLKGGLSGRSGFGEACFGVCEGDFGDRCFRIGESNFRDILRGGDRRRDHDAVWCYWV
jgi:hypothetical protein